MKRLELVLGHHYIGKIGASVAEFTLLASEDSEAITIIPKFLFFGEEWYSYRVKIKPEIYDLIKDHSYQISMAPYDITSERLDRDIFLDFPDISDDEFLLLKLAWT